jgi:hypothetical protein
VAASIRACGTRPRCLSSQAGVFQIACKGVTHRRPRTGLPAVYVLMWCKPQLSTLAFRVILRYRMLIKSYSTQNLLVLASTMHKVCSVTAKSASNRTCLTAVWKTFMTGPSRLFRLTRRAVCFSRVNGTAQGPVTCVTTRNCSYKL